MVKEIIIPIIDKITNRKPITAISYDDECWFCNSHAKDKDGYCKIHFRGIDTRVHRVMYLLFNGPIPKGLKVRHICDHPDCINPNHLILGTDADNALDRKVHGTYLIGENVGTSKLHEIDVYEILANIADSIQEIANKYNVTESTIRSIKNGKTWEHVHDKYLQELSHEPKMRRMPNKPSINLDKTKDKRREKKQRIKP